MTSKKERDKEARFQGTPLSEGIAIGPPFFLPLREEETVPEFPIEMCEVDHEIDRYRSALFSSRQDLVELQGELMKQGSIDAVTILDTHLQILEDPLITTRVEEKIRKMQRNTEAVFRSTIREYERKLTQSSSFFQERAFDVKDLSRRILHHLAPKPKDEAKLMPHSVVVAYELPPSFAAAVEGSQVAAFVTELGGATSHAALIARAKGIPYVTGIDLEAMQDLSIDCILVDGNAGLVITNPLRATLKSYRLRRCETTKTTVFVTCESEAPSETQEGIPVSVCGNIGSLSEVDGLHEIRAAGIGLFRSEFLFFNREEHLMNEAAQFAMYKELVEKANGLPVTLRVLDIGGDKKLLTIPNEGALRGIRFLLQERSLFKVQLRAALRAAHFGDLRLMLPMVADVRELKLAKALIEEVHRELKEQGIPHKEKILLGSMIEVPSAVLLCEQIARECDFLSIGSNDLLYYALGRERSGTAAPSPAHPGLLHLIRQVVEAAKRTEKPLTLCGEMAAVPIFIPLLLGLGIVSFSCSPRFIPLVRCVIRRSRIEEAQLLAHEILQLSTHDEVEAHLKARIVELMPEMASMI